MSIHCVLLLNIFPEAHDLKFMLLSLELIGFQQKFGFSAVYCEAGLICILKRSFFTCNCNLCLTEHGLHLVYDFVMGLLAIEVFIGEHGVLVRAFCLCWGGIRFESLSTHNCWSLRKSFITSLKVWSMTKNNAFGGGKQKKRATVCNDPLVGSHFLFLQSWRKAECFLVQNYLRPSFGRWTLSQLISLF